MDNAGQIADFGAAVHECASETTIGGAGAGQDADSTETAAESGASRDSAPASWFPPPPQRPTQLDASGIRFDFNDGCRVQAPVEPERWRIRLFDLDTATQTLESLNIDNTIRATRNFMFKNDTTRPCAARAMRAGKVISRILAAAARQGKGMKLGAKR